MAALNAFHHFGVDFAPFLVFAVSRDPHAFTEAELLSRRALTRQPHIRADKRPTPLSPIRAGGVPKRAAPIWRTELVAQGLLR